MGSEMCIRDRHTGVLLGEQRGSNPRLRRSNRLTGAAAFAAFGGSRNEVRGGRRSSSSLRSHPYRLIHTARSFNGLGHRSDKAKTKVRLLLGLLGVLSQQEMKRVQTCHID